MCLYFHEQYTYVLICNRMHLIVYAAVSKLGLPCAFLSKVIHIDFKLEKYIQIKEKMFPIFSCSINVIPSFHLNQTAYIC